MCRSIKQLRCPGPLPGDDEIRAAALQYVRKVSGFRAPSQANHAAVEQAVDEIAEATRRLCKQLVRREHGDSMEAEVS